MTPVRPLLLRLSAAALVLVVAACQDQPAPTDLEGEMQGPVTVTQEMRGWANAAVPEVMALPQTVFGGLDESTGQMVFGVEHPGVARGIENVMARRGIPASSWRVQVTEPIHFAATLRDRHRPTMGGLQIHFSNYLCTLGFSVDHAGGRSFITNSHCTDQQGTTGTTAYYQPASNVDSSPIAIEADDPAYLKGGECSRGKQCRYSDASRALYASGVASNGAIAKTTSINSGDLNVSGSFNISGQNNSSTTFSGTINKVGRTTGWSSGDVTNTCVRVNVSGTNIQLLCQTIVENNSATIVQGGDSGSPVFQGSGSNVTLVGILWGGNSSGSLFVFSPLKQIQDELGAMDATTDGVGGDGGSEPPPPEEDEPNCPPNSNAPKCRG
jgi:hypothetical protein